jgi:hypothetical protein
MPDGDIIHSRLRWVYQKPYKWLCEGKADSQECAWVVMKALLKDIKNKGNEPIKLAKSIGSTISQVINDFSKNGVVSWTALSEELNRLAQQTRVSHYIKELVIHAAKEVIHDLRYQKIVDTNNLSEVVVERYMQQVYKSNFEKCIPLTPKHYAGVDAKTLETRIKAIKPEISNAISYWANQANTGDEVKKLRRPVRRKVTQIKPVDLNENLL